MMRFNNTETAMKFKIKINIIKKSQSSLCEWR